jgi:thiamine-phosphate pyrophosphorylase
VRLPEPPLLCLVTDRLRCGGRPLEEVVEGAVAGGVDIVQLREKDMPAGPLLDLARRLRHITASRARLFVNDRVDVALASGADGVHLGESSIPVEVARSLVGDALLIGRSVHAVESAIDASRAGADMVVFGTVFATASHPNQRPSGVAPLAELSRHDTAPVLGIGGITIDNVGEVVKAGASGAAVITAITESPDPQEAAKSLRRAITDACRRTRSVEGALA